MKKFEEKLGIGVLELLMLALVGVPRVILHDLSLIEEGTFVNALFVFVPVIIWITYLLYKKVKAPFLSMFILCVMYGVFLALAHQMLWMQAFPEPVQLGGNLTELPDAASQVIIRGFAFLSSLTTGAVMGVLLGVVTWILNGLMNMIGGWKS